MPTDWLGIGLSIMIVLMIIAIVVAKIQGDRVIDVMAQFLDFVRGNK